MYAYLRNAMGSLVNRLPQDDHLAATNLVDRAPYPARLRVILVLSLMSWIMIALTAAWVMRFL